ncbi:hypothetical protein [Microbacterium sp. Marseille-Q6965]|uniref:hypothetical protein n=1 Tax=Microbacterium sp. Marseille-Q6965 TaxID=2965072 RepID=UPI0021B6FF72|nr:hypothetical protein [Microbacterium sp. Marseille-Q6965]
MSRDVRHVTHVLYPTAQDDDHGPWSNPEAAAEIEALLADGYEIADTSVAPLTSPWLWSGRMVSSTRLVLVTTLVRPGPA